MAEQEIYPLVAIDPVANAQNEWVALRLRLSPTAGVDASRAWQAVIGQSDLWAAIAPLDGLLALDNLAALTPSTLTLLPVNRIGLVVDGAVLAQAGAAARLNELHGAGYRIWLDGHIPDGITPPSALRCIARDCRVDAPPPGRLASLFGPHLAHGIGSGLRFSQCENAGFDWFCGDYPLDPCAAPRPNDDGSSRRRLLTMLGLLARDADARELEDQIKQDPALAYHLLKLVNSAAFAVSTQITSFGQAIALLGRRQLQRWLQLLLYARAQPDSLPNLLLPLAARRGAQVEALCRQHGGTVEEQDLAFMTGVFSLLDRLLQTPMNQIAPELQLPATVSAALVGRAGKLGAWLALTEADPDAAALAAAGVSAGDWWRSQLQAYHWAIQVGRNV